MKRLRAIGTGFLAIALAVPLGAQPELEGPIVNAFRDRGLAVYVDALQAYHGSDLQGGDGVWHRAGWDLTYLAHRWAAGLGYDKMSGAGSLAFVDGNHVMIEILARDPETVAARLREAGYEASVSGHLVSLECPFVYLATLIQDGAIHSMRPAMALRQVGATTSQGDRALRADEARGLSPQTDGRGVKIGTLSDTYDNSPSALNNAAADRSTGDVPASVQVLREGPFAGSIDEGRAMIQIVRDLAPEAEQAFYSAFFGQADFANGIRQLRVAGCDIIVDDILYFAEPMFQDGVVAQAVDEVTADGAVYFSAAGNSARQSYESAFRASSTQIRAGGRLTVPHDFDPGPDEDVWQEIRVTVGTSVTVVLQWDEPFFSVSGSPGSQSDLDIFITGAGDGRFAAVAGTTAFNIGGDPVEIFSFTNDGSFDLDGLAGPDEVFNFVILRAAGASPGLLKYVYFTSGGTVSVNEFATDSPTSYGHANARGAIAVGAAFYGNTPRFGIATPILESFSSAGGVPILFDANGNRLVTPELRQKPEIVAADGGNTTFFGTDVEGDGFPNFFGTSAAAPHAAAVAALLHQRAGSLNRDETLEHLRRSAIDMGPPGTDNDSGAGLIDAQAVLGSAPFGFSAWQVLNFPNVTTFEDLENPPTDALAEGDPDADGLANAFEFLTGGDPFQADPSPVQLTRNSPLEFRVQVDPMANPTSLSLEFSDDLLEFWPSGVPLVLDESTNQLTAVVPEDLAVGFYRLSIVP
ncbi:MAG: S8 family serine peptidase [Opitutales bacterium]